MYEGATGLCITRPVIYLCSLFLEGAGWTIRLVCACLRATLILRISLYACLAMAMLTGPSEALAYYSVELNCIVEVPPLSPCYDDLLAGCVILDVAATVTMLGCPTQVSSSLLVSSTTAATVRAT